MKKHLVSLLSMLILLNVAAQDIKYARSVVLELASTEYYGRGYVKNGDKKAARFLEKQFKSFGLKKFNNSYYQKYSFPINTFPGKISVSIDGKELVPGEDYVISSSAPSVDKEFLLYNISNRTINPDSLILLMNETKQKGMFLIGEKNTRSIYGKTLPGIESVAVLTKKTPYWHVSNGGSVGNTAWMKIKETKVPETSEEISVKFKNKFIEDYKTQNVIAYAEGSKYPDKYFVFTAHYDHLGMMGNETYYPGANDNASGTAMVLDMARHFSLPENQPEYSIVFLLLSGEESGLHGSSYFVTNPLFPLENIELVVNLDMVGSGSEGITVVNGTLFDSLVQKMQKINSENNYLKDIAPRGESCNSDHCPFFQHGVQSVFIYTRGKELQVYHTVDDTAEGFPFTAYEGLFRLLTDICKN